MSTKVVFDHSGKIVDSIKKMISRAVYVGIPSDSKKRKPEKDKSPKEEAKKKKKPKKAREEISNAKLGAINEFGDPKRNIPPRPFLEPAIKEEQKNVDRIIKKTSKQTIVVGGDVDTALTFVGIAVTKRAKKNIKDSVDMQDLSERTLQARKRKGFEGTKPLIVTGQLVNSIHYAVGDSGKN